MTPELQIRLAVKNDAQLLADLNLPVQALHAEHNPVLFKAETALTCLQVSCKTRRIASTLPTMAMFQQATFGIKSATSLKPQSNTPIPA